MTAELALRRYRTVNFRLVDFDTHDVRIITLVIGFYPQLSLPLASVRLLRNQVPDHLVLLRAQISHFGRQLMLQN